MAPKNGKKDTENRLIREGMQHLILCEGQDEWGFLVYYLNSPALSAYPALSEVVQVEDFGGNEQLKTQLLLWTKVPGFENLKSLVVIRDAERNAEGAAQSVMSSFQNDGLPVPPTPGVMHRTEPLATGFLLFPSCSNHPQNGTLEDLCLSILEDTDHLTLAEVSTFLESLKDRKIRSFPHEFKSKLHTYFSITDDYVSLKVGEAARAGAFDWASPKLQPLREFLISMVSEV